jgi:Cu(I)/Ag(I) efflux system periplasmic protein CusF
MIRRDILWMIVAIVAASSSARSVLGWDAGQPNDRVLFAGRIVKLDADAGKITIEHMPIWPQHKESITMVFRVNDPLLFVGLAVGDKIRFRVERDREGIVITRMENSN